MEENNNNTALEKVQPDNGSYYEKKYDYYENKAYDTYDYMEEAKRINTKEEPSTAAKVALILIAVYFNVIGAIIGIVAGGIYVNKNGAGYKSFGKMLLIVSIVFLVIDIVLWLMVFAAIGNYLAMFYMY
jgi:hypothetical protein